MVLKWENSCVALDMLMETSTCRPSAAGWPEDSSGLMRANAARAAWASDAGGVF